MPGLYRIKPVDINKLAYIGQTGRNLRERVIGHLAKHAMLEEMPFNDPHTAAPSLWAWRDAEGMKFEFSVAQVQLPDREREALECYLLWQYRLEAGESTMCNHGRFHPQYIKSSQKKQLRQGYRLPAEEQNPAGGASMSPLHMHGEPIDNDFMGLVWSELQPLLTTKQVIAEKKGIYKILDAITGELLYVGESQNLRQRIPNHKRKPWGHYEPVFSYVIQLDDILPYQLKELENDLIGAWYLITGKGPVFQFLSSK
ncbi:GIY-YIG nuclease family protein [Aneurinibacillus aneurinilyticus]|uniref:GIY-YIG nuclease family protein n=1 Tax=Aneurinibacillus aneurinilyticus TaxID=1391 RepID=UPI0035258E89